MANEYLKRTPTSTGNRKVWTWSGWVKRNQISSDSFVFSAGSQVNNWGGIHLNATRGVGLLDVVSGSVPLQVQTKEARRDASSWFNVVVSVDTTKENSQDRVRMYVDGVNLTEFQTHITVQYDNTWVNSLTMHGVGRLYDGANPFATESEMFDIFFVDGQALTPDVFGFYKDGDGYVSVGSTQATDFRPGQWSPHTPRKIKSDIERRGGFGVNGFYLPLNDSSNVGADFHCTPNSIIKLKGEDLPQPRNGAPTTSDAYVSQLRQETGTLGFDGVVAFDGSALNRLTLPVSSDFAFGTGDLTVEMFVYHTDLTGQQTYFGDTYAATAGLYLYKTSTNQISVYDTAQRAVSAANVIKKGQWHHLAWTVSSGVLRQFVDGNKITETSYNGNYTTTEYFLGDTGGTSSGEFIGFMSNVRVIKGTALYTANFTPPTEPLTNVTNTKLLCCNSSTSATSATVTPGTITKTSNVFATRNELTGSIVLAVPGASLKNDIDLDDTELIDNTGWVDYAGDSATVTVSSGTVTVDNGASNTNGRAISAVFNTTVGQSYKISFKAVSNTGSAGFYTEIRESNGFGSTQVFNAGTTLGFHDFSFVATETAHTFTLYALATGGSTTYSDISIKKTNNLIGNGSFDFNTTGWTATDCTTAWEDGQLKITRSGGSGLTANQAFTTVSGKRYTITGTINSSGSRGDLRVYNGSGTSGSTIVSLSGTNGSVTHLKGSFTASSTTSTVVITIDVNGTVVYADNIVVKQEDAPRDYSADIKDSGTNRTPTVTGPAGVGYEIPSYYGSAINTTSATDALYYDVDGSGSNAYGTGDFTFECWFYATEEPSAWGILMKHATNGSWDNGITLCSKHNTTRKFNIYTQDGSSNVQIIGGTVWALNQWHHVVAERYNGQITLYVNGVAEVTRADTRNYAVAGTPASSAQYALSIGAQSDGNYQSTGYFQDVRVYKGVAKYKGGFDVPKPYAPVGFEGESWRQVSDTCKNNFATWNPLLGPQGCALADGNLTVTSDGANQHKGTRSTMGMGSGKWYWEYRVGSVVTNSYVGVSEGMTPNGLTTPNHILHGTGGNNYVNPNGSFSVTDASFTTGMIIGCAFDRDASSNQLKIYKNGTLAVTGNCSGLIDGVLYLAHNSFNAAVSDGWEGNFGQNPTFSGTVTAGTYTDSNGKGLFKFQPPAGYLALCEDNLPTPAIADPGKHFRTVLYTGTGSSRAVTGVGFKPDFIWCKSRTNTEGHILFDSVRGPEQRLLAMGTQVEATSAGGVISFDDDGYSTAQYTGTNQSGQDYVAWCWKAGGAAVSNTDGTITSQVSANQDAGFSIVSYTGNGTVGATVGHGLGKKPKFFITKNRDTTANWPVFSAELLGSNGYMYLNLTNSAATTSGISGPTSSVLTLSGYSDMNKSGDDMIAYCWAEIDGYSKIGSYTGNGSTDGPFVYCGFKPAFIIRKRTTNTGGWYLTDSARNSSNPVNTFLDSSDSDADGTGTDVDFLSNGFKLRNSDSGTNASGATYIFMAFAESPFQTANAK